MMITGNMTAALAALAHRLGLASSASGPRERLTLQVDGYRRVTACAQERGQVALEVLLLALPSARHEQAALLERALRHVSAAAARWPATLALSADGQQLLLQASWSGQGSASLELALEELLNCADRWSAVLGVTP